MTTATRTWPVYKELSHCIRDFQTYERACFFDKANVQALQIEALIREHLPSGSGIDTGVHINLSTHQTPNHITLTFGYHHMNEHGYYTHWTYHKAIITASLIHDFDLRITGKDKLGLKDYLYDVFAFALRQEIERYSYGLTLTRNGAF